MPDQQDRLTVAVVSALGKLFAQTAEAMLPKGKGKVGHRVLPGFGKNQMNAPKGGSVCKTKGRRYICRSGKHLSSDKCYACMPKDRTAHGRSHERR